MQKSIKVACPECGYVFRTSGNTDEKGHLLGAAWCIRCGPQAVFLKSECRNIYLQHSAHLEPS